MATKKSRATAAALLASGGQGSDPAALRKLLGDKEYRKLVKSLHGQGLSVRGYTPGVPLSLQPRLNKSLLEEATKTVGAAYKPAELELSTAESNVKNITAKRAADNKVYASWVTGINAQFAAGNAAATSALVDQQRVNHQGYITATQQVQSLGTGNDAYLSAQREGGQGRLAAEEQRGVTQQQQGQKTSELIGSLAGQNVAAMAQSDNAKGAADLKTIGESKLKLSTEKGAKISEVLQTLKGNETSKAEQQQSIAAAASALGEKTALEKYKIRANAEQKELDRQSREDIAHERTTATNAATSARTEAQRNTFLGKYGVTPEAFKKASPTKRLQIIKAAKKAGTAPGAAGKPLTEVQKKAARSRDNKTIGSIQQSEASFKSGGYFKAGDTVQEFRDAITSPAAQGGLGISDPVIVRYLIEKYHNHKVSAKTRKALEDKLGDSSRLAELGL